MRQGYTIWLTGLSGAGKTTIADLLAKKCRDSCIATELLDGDIVRSRLSPDLGFGKTSRDEHVYRIAFLCELLSKHGVTSIVAAISPYRQTRDEVRAMLPNYIEVYVKCPIEVLIKRDTKGLYRRALAGQIANFTGVSDPYEPPIDPDLTICSNYQTAQESAEILWTFLTTQIASFGTQRDLLPSTSSNLLEHSPIE